MAHSETPFWFEELDDRLVPPDFQKQLQDLREQTTQLERINTLLRNSSVELARAQTPQAILNTLLLHAVAAMNGSAGGLLRRLDGSAHEFAALQQNGVMVPPEEWPEEPMIIESAEVTRLDTHGVIRRVMAGEQVWLLVNDFLADWAPGAASFHRSHSNKAMILAPFSIEGQVAGFLGIAFAHTRRPSPAQSETLKALSHQAGLALELNAMHAHVERAASAHERELVAQERAAELAEANNILAVRSSLMEVLAEESRLLLQAEEPMPAVLRLIERVGKTAQLSRVLFIEDHGPFHRVEIEWCADDIRNHASVGKTHFLNADMKDFAAPGRSGQAVWKKREELDELSLRALQPLALLATGYAPVFVEGIYRGVLAFDDCCVARTWDQAHVDALSAAANLIGCAIGNRQLRERYATAREQAAQERAAELERANEALRKGIAGLRDLEDLSTFLQEMLRAAVITASAHGAGVVLISENAATYRVFPLLRVFGEFEPAGSELTSDLPITAGVRSIFDDAAASSSAWFCPPDDPRMGHPYRTFHAAEGNLAVMHIPMRAGDRLLGLLGLGFPTPDPEVRKALSLLRSLADQMAMAVEMLRLSNEAKSAAVVRAQEKLSRERAAELAKANEQLALRDRLLTASAKALERLMSAQDFATGIPEALRQIGEAASLSRVQVLLQKRLETGVMAHELIYEWWSGGLTSQQAMGYCVFPDKSFQEVVDRLVEGSRWWARIEDWPAGVHPVFQELGIVSSGVVPIFVQQKYVGLVAFDQCVSGREWTEAETDALAIAARGIGAALSQERIMEQLAREREKAAQERAAELVKANRVLRNSVDDLVTKTSTDGILTSLLKQVIDISGANSGAVLRRVGGSEFEYAIIYADGVIRSSQAILASGTNVEIRTASRLDPTGHFRSLSNGTALWREVDDRRLADLLPRSTAYHKSAGNRSIYDFPYKVAGEVFGYLGLAFREQQPPGEVVQETIKALATQVGLALEFRRISEQVERAAITEERNKFARDLHDTLAQGFAGILMQLGAAGQKAAFPPELEPYLNRIDDLARTNLAEARRTVSELRSANRLREPLPGRLTELASRLGSSYGNLIRVDLVGTQRTISAEVEEEVFLIAQESLTNAVKHAQATEIKVELTFLESGLRLKVKDNGIGFSSEQRKKTDHFGLQTMQERSQRIGASMTIISERGFGTEILTLWKE